MTLGFGGAIVRGFLMEKGALTALVKLGRRSVVSARAKEVVAQFAHAAARAVAKGVVPGVRGQAAAKLARAGVVAGLGQPAMKAPLAGGSIQVAVE